MKPSLWKYNLLLHATVFLFGFTGIFGKLISITGDQLVWYRIFIAIATISIFMFFSKTSFRLPLKDIIQLLGVGVVVAIHWVAFFESIKITNSVSIALACLASGTLFVAILEPLFFKTTISFLEIIAGVVIIFAILLIIKVEYEYIYGILIGLLSAFLSSLFTIFNKKLTHKYNSLSMSFYELLGGFVLLSLYFIIFNQQVFKFQVKPIDWVWLLILGIVCTAFPFWAINKVLLKLSAYNVVLAINLEPIYAFLLAAWIFHEHEKLNFTFYLGAFLIIFVVGVYSYIKYIRFKKEFNTKV